MVQDAPANTLGILRIMFAVDDIDEAVARLLAHGAELVGEVCGTRTATGSARHDAVRDDLWCPSASMVGLDQPI